MWLFHCLSHIPVQCLVYNVHVHCPVCPPLPQVEQLLGQVEAQLHTSSKGQLIAQSDQLLQLAVAANKKPMAAFVSASQVSCLAS